MTVADTYTTLVTTAAAVSTAVQQGCGAMPARLVTGHEQVDVVVYVASVSSASG